MLYLDFSCTQKLVTLTNPSTQKGSLEDRVYALFSSVFLLVDASFHLLTATYKSFIWTASQVLHKNPPKYYKEAYSHFAKALCCTSMIPFGSAIGIICPSLFQSKKLQEYLGWKASLTNTSEIIENNKTLKKEIKELKSQIDSLNKIILPAISQDNPQPLEANLALANTVNPGSSYRKDIISPNPESDDEFLDALEDISDLNEILEKELQSKNKEIKELKSQIDLLKKILFPLQTVHPYNQILVIHKLLHKSIKDTPTIYEFLSDLIKTEINVAFQPKFNVNFLQFCTQANPDINSASQILTELLNKHNFRSWSNPKETSISAFINTLFGFV